MPDLLPLLQPGDGVHVSVQPHQLGHLHDAGLPHVRHRRQRVLRHPGRQQGSGWSPILSAAGGDESLNVSDGLHLSHSKG